MPVDLKTFRDKATGQLNRLLRRAKGKPVQLGHPSEVAREPSSSILDEGSIDGIALLNDGRELGAAFVLDGPARSDATALVENGWLVETRQNSLAVVARGHTEGEAPAVAEVLERALSAAQHGLDLIAMRGLGNNLITRADDEHLVWWVADGEHVLRIHALAVAYMDVPPVKVTVTDAAGNPRPQPDPAVLWHPSFRYFRLAQVSDEVFDAYRNVYLALEAVISTMTTKLRHESEPDWIRRALSTAATAGLDLASFAAPSEADPIEAIIRDLYSATRTATFHAKVDQPTLLPLDPVDRVAVNISLTRLSSLYLALVEQRLGVRRPSGAVMRGGFELMIASPVQELQISVTDDPVRFDETHTTINPGGGLVHRLDTRPAPEFDIPFVATVIGTASVRELAALSHVSRIVATDIAGNPITGGQLEGRLTLGGFESLEVTMGVRGAMPAPRAHSSPSR